MEALQRLHNRGSVSTGPVEHDIDNSLKFEPDNSEYIYRTPSSAGNRKTWTLSFWIKRTEPADGSNTMRVFEAWDGSTGTSGLFTATDNFILDLNAGSNYFTSSAVFRDCSAWYHFVIRVDTTQGTAANRARVYVNGSELAGSWNSNISQNTDLTWNEDVAHNFARFHNNDSFVSGYYAEIVNVDGTSLAPDSFGATDPDTGIWIPQPFTGSYGTNGFKLEFKSSGSLGADTSGNSHTWSLNALAAADQSTDTPTNNFCTLNPLVNFKYGTNIGGMTNGATVFGDNTGGGVGGAFGTFGVTAGKWYWEMKLTQQVAHYPGVSAIDDGDNVYASTDPQDENSTFNYNISAARREYVNSGTLTYGSLDEFGDFHSVGDIIAIALNMDDNQISIYCNGTLQSGIANSSLFDAANKMCVPFHGTINDEVQYNFGGYSVWTPSSVANDQNGYGTFEYAPPSGYYALCTKNLSEFGG